MFGLYLKQARLSAGISQIQVAHKLGYQTSQFISNWERGVSHPPIPTIKKLGEIYSIDPESLFQATLQAKTSRIADELREKFNESILV